MINLQKTNKTTKKVELQCTFGVKNVKNTIKIDQFHPPNMQNHTRLKYSTHKHAKS